MNTEDKLIQFIKKETERINKEENTIYVIDEERYREITWSLLEIEPHLSSDDFKLQLLEERRNGFFLHLVITGKKLTIREHLYINKLYYHFPNIKLFPLRDEFALHLYSNNLSVSHSSRGFGSMHMDLARIQEICTLLLKPRKVFYKAFTHHYEFKIKASSLTDPKHVLKSLFCISDKVKISTGYYKDEREILLNFIIPKDYKSRKDYRLTHPLKIGNETFIHVDGFDFTNT